MSNQTAPLGNFAEVNPESIAKAYPHDEILYIDISSVGSGHLVEPPKLLSLNNAPSRAKRIVRDGDIILATVRPNLRSFLFIREPEDNTIVSTGFAVIRAKENIDPRFIYYAISDKQFTGYLTNNTKGTSYPAVDTDTVLRGEIPDFNLSQQQSIASILSAYDDLIANNRRRIQLLEQSARLLYKEWFVHLRFPGHEHTTITDGVPEGWDRVPLSQLCTDVRESINPKDLPPYTVYIGLEHIPRRSITLKDWGIATDVSSKKFKFVESDILFGKIRPYFHKVGFAPVDGITSSDTIVVRPLESHLHYYVLFFLSSDEFIALASKTVREGSKMPRADWNFLLKSMFTVPSPTLLSLFSDTMAPICSQLRNLALHNHKLAYARDLILPRLMNEEVTI